MKIYISSQEYLECHGLDSKQRCEYLGQYLDLQRSVLNFNKTGRAGDLWTVSFMTFLSLLQAITWQWWFPPDHVLQTTGWPGEMAQWHTGNSGSFSQETDISRHDVNHSKNVGRFHTNALNNYQICNKQYKLNDFSILYNSLEKVSVRRKASRLLILCLCYIYFSILNDDIEPLNPVI